MTHVLAQVRFKRTTGLPQDVIVNTFNFDTPGAPLQADYDSIASRLNDFYNATNAPQTQNLAYFYSDVIANTGHEVRLYNMAQPMPRPPAHTAPITMVPAAGTSLPAEVALCLSFRANLVAGTVAARRRGRVYLGPFQTARAILSDSAGDARPGADLRAIAAAAGKRLMDTSGPVWVVASQPTPAGPITMATVTACWVDDAFDTQRRRGADATARTEAFKAAV